MEKNQSQQLTSAGQQLKKKRKRNLMTPCTHVSEGMYDRPAHDKPMRISLLHYNLI